MPTITNKRNGKSWVGTEVEADTIEKSPFRNLYIINRVKVPDEVIALKEKLNELPPAAVPLKKAKGNQSNKKPK